MPLFAWAILALIAAYVITTVATKTVKPKPALLEEFEFPQVEEGSQQIVYFGDCWVDSWFVLWYGNYRTIKIKSSGAKK